MARSIDGVDVHRRVDHRHLRPVRQVCLDRIVGELLDEVGLPVVLEAGGNERVERRIEGGIGHRADVLRDDGRDVVERLQHGLPFVERSGPARHECEEGLAVPLFGDERQRRRDLEGGEPAELFGGIGDELPVEPKDVAGVLQLEEHGPAVDVLDRLQLVLERGHDTEVAAAPAKAPEQIGVHVLVRHQEPAVRGDDVGGDQVVAGQAEPA